ncbi:hypothetical protein GCM10027285_07140 [Oleiagrimonas citrea]
MNKAVSRRTMSGSSTRCHHAPGASNNSDGTVPQRSTQAISCADELSVKAVKKATQATTSNNVAHRGPR